ncbi:MAG: hypothetical protein PHW19_04810 [Salinivirgaceae bacterium]|nr:hypothetical protein [Salinivirgaceae bacterium]
MITRENYEIYFIDYLDKTLSESMVAEFNAFLLKNPDLAEELDFISEVKLEPNVCEFDGAALKREIGDLAFTEQNSDELLVSVLENDFPNARKEELMAWIEENQSVSKSYELFKKTKLEGEELQYHAKETLFKLPDFDKELVSPENAQMFAIASLENDLSRDTKMKWEQFLRAQQNPKEFDFTQTTLLADHSITYSDKKSLLRSKRKFLFIGISVISAVAAGLMILFGISQLMDRQHIMDTNVVAYEFPVELESTDIQSIEKEVTPNEVAEESKPVKTLKTEIVPIVRKVNESGIEPRVFENIERVVPREYASMNVYQDNFENIHGATLDIDLLYAALYDTNKEIKSNMFEEDPSLPVLLYRRLGLKKAAEWGIAQIIRNPDRYTFKTEYNDKNEMVYFALSTPIFAIERKRK